MDSVAKGTYLHELVENGEINLSCMMCQVSFIPEILKGKKITDIFAPRHKAKEWCKSGKHPHCTCDSCF